MQPYMSVHILPAFPHGCMGQRAATLQRAFLEGLPDSTAGRGGSQAALSPAPGDARGTDCPGLTTLGPIPGGLGRHRSCKQGCPGEGTPERMHTGNGGGEKALEGGAPGEPGTWAEVRRALGHCWPALLPYLELFPLAWMPESTEGSKATYYLPGPPAVRQVVLLQGAGGGPSAPLPCQLGR